MRGLSHFELGEFVAARVALECGVGFGDAAHRTVEEAPVDSYIMTLANLAMTLTCLGYLDQARSSLDEALSKARQLGHGHMLAYTPTPGEPEKAPCESVLPRF
jgi:hypothetical protein